MDTTRPLPATQIEAVRYFKDSDACRDFLAFKVCLQGTKKLFAKFKRDHYLTDDTVTKRMERTELGAAPEIAAAIPYPVHYDGAHKICIAIRELLRIRAHRDLIRVARVGFHKRDDLAYHFGYRDS